jgi:hypothetical protein
MTVATGNRDQIINWLKKFAANLGEVVPWRHEKAVVLSETKGKNRKTITIILPVFVYREEKPNYVVYEVLFHLDECAYIPNRYILSLFELDKGLVDPFRGQPGWKGPKDARASKKFYKLEDMYRAVSKLRDTKIAGVANENSWLAKRVEDIDKRLVQIESTTDLRDFFLLYSLLCKFKGLRCFFDESQLPPP